MSDCVGSKAELPSKEEQKKQVIKVPHRITVDLEVIWDPADDHGEFVTMGDLCKELDSALEDILARGKLDGCRHRIYVEEAEDN